MTFDVRMILFAVLCPLPGAQVAAYLSYTAPYYAWTRQNWTRCMRPFDFEAVLRDVYVGFEVETNPSQGVSSDYITSLSPYKSYPPNPQSLQ